MGIIASHRSGGVRMHFFLHYLKIFGLQMILERAVGKSCCKRRRKVLARIFSLPIQYTDEKELDVAKNARAK